MIVTCTTRVSSCVSICECASRILLTGRVMGRMGQVGYRGEALDGWRNRDGERKEGSV